MLKGLLEIFEFVKPLGENVWNFLNLTPGQAYDLYCRGPLTSWSQSLAYRILDLGGGDRNPLTDWAYAIIDDTVLSWTEAVLEGPSTFFYDVIDYPLVTVIFGSGLLVALAWRLVSWVIDILP